MNALPVSYTHLDVYKRQDQSRVLPLENGSAQLTDHMFDNDALVFDHQIDWAGIGYPDGTPYVSLSLSLIHI